MFGVSPVWFSIICFLSLILLFFASALIALMCLSLLDYPACLVCVLFCVSSLFKPSVLFSLGCVLVTNSECSILIPNLNYLDDIWSAFCLDITVSDCV